MNLVDERLEVGGNAPSFGGGAADRRLAGAGTLQNAVEDLVAESRVGVGHGGENV
jgi:hypothetical protein